MAAPDTVVLSATTFRLAEGFFDCEDLGFQALTGVATPVQVYRVVRDSGVQRRLDIAQTRGLPIHWIY